jgi:hypothetical protein
VDASGCLKSIRSVSPNLDRGQQTYDTSLDRCRRATKQTSHYFSSVPASPLRPLPGSVTWNKKNTGNMRRSSPLLRKSARLWSSTKACVRNCALLTFGKVDGPSGRCPWIAFSRHSSARSRHLYWSKTPVVIAPGAATRSVIGGMEDLAFPEGTRCSCRSISARRDAQTNFI